MMNKNERMNKLNNAGINTGKYFNIDLPQGLKPGATISLVINEDGQPVVVANNDPIANQIIEDGYVRNTKLHRRFVMAQMFQMLNWVSYDRYDRGYSACLRLAYSYEYTFKMMLEEVKVLSKLEVRDMESFEERSHFFSKNVIVSVLNDYMKKLKDYVDNMPNKKCKGVPYKRMKGKDIFVEDLNKKLYRPLEAVIFCIKTAKNYHEIYMYLNDFMNNMVGLPHDTPKSSVWVDAFKGEGAYYTLKNLVMFHNCKIFNADLEFGVVSGIDAVNYIKNKLEVYYGNGWRMFALMKKVINDNGINTKTYIGEVCNK